MAYTFTTTILSAQKVGSPTPTNCSLSATAVEFLSGNNVKFAEKLAVVVSLSTNDVGLSFNKQTVTIAPNALLTFNLTAYPSDNVTIDGSVFTLPRLLHATPVAVVKTLTNNLRNYTVVTYLSSASTITSALSNITNDVSDPEIRRKWTYGYM